MSILDLLLRRKADRELSAQEYVTEAIRLEATGKADKIDVGKLEQHLAAVGITADGFAGAVEREKEINRLRTIIDGKDEASEQFRALAEQAKTTRANNDAEIVRLNAESDEADEAATKTRRAVDAIGAAERELRTLMDSPEQRAQRTEAKHHVSASMQRYRAVAEQIRQLGATVSGLSDIESGLAPRQKEDLAAKREELKRLHSEYDELENAVNAGNARLESLEAELV